MFLQEIQQDLSKIREINALQFISDRTRTRFSIRGGVVRNILLGYEEWKEKDSSLFEFVDAFADIDLVIQDRSVWLILWQQITAIIPFAEFHRWEPTTSNRIKDEASQRMFHPIDRFRIDFEPESSPKFAGTHIEAEDQWKLIKEGQPTPFASGSISMHQKQMRRLRLLRYKLQFPNFKGAFTEEGENYSNEQNVAVEFTAEPKTLNETSLSIAVMKLLFSVPNELLSEEIYSVVKRQSLQFLTESPNEVLVGSVTKNPSTAKLELQMHRYSRDRNLMGSASFVPSLSITVPSIPVDPCCNYRDFSHMPTVIAWKFNMPHEELIVRKEIAVIGTYQNYPTPEASLQSKPSSPARPTFGLPGIVSVGASIVARIDASFAASNYGRAETLMVGLADVTGNQNG